MLQLKSTVQYFVEDPLRLLTVLAGRCEDSREWVEAEKARTEGQRGDTSWQPSKWRIN